MTLNWTPAIYQRLNLLAFYAPMIPREILDADDKSDMKIQPFFNELIGESLARLDDVRTLSFFRTYEFKIFFKLREIYLELEKIFEEISCERFCVLPLHRKFVEEIKVQKQLKTDEILKTGRYLFSSIYKLAVFFEKFINIYENFKLVKNLSRFDFLCDTRKELLFMMFFAPRELRAGLMCSISDLNSLLERIPDITDNGFISQKDLSAIISSAKDLSAELHIMQSKQYRTPSKKELRRREKISYTRKERNREIADNVKKICEYIKRSASKKVTTTKHECELFFQENRMTLAKYGINSSRTLENRCSTQNPNNKRREKNTIDASIPIPEIFWIDFDKITSDKSTVI